MRAAVLVLAGAIVAALTSAEAAKADVLVNRPYFDEGGLIDGRCSPCVSPGAEPDHRGWAVIDPSTDWTIDSATLWIDIPKAYVPMENFSLSVWERATNEELLHEDFVFAAVDKTLFAEDDSARRYRIELSLPDWELSPGSYFLSYFGDGTTQWLTAREDLATGFTGWQTVGTSSPVDGILLPETSPRNWFFVLRGDTAAVPEPAMTGLLGLGVLILGLSRRVRQDRASRRLNGTR